MYAKKNTTKPEERENITQQRLNGRLPPSSTWSATTADKYPRGENRLDTSE